MKVKVTTRKYMGDDLYSWAVFRSDQAVPVVSGLSRSEASYHKRVVQQMITRRGRRSRVPQGTRVGPSGATACRDREVRLEDPSQICNRGQP